MPEVSIRTMLVLTITAWAGACTSEQPQAETTADAPATVGTATDYDCR